MLVEAEFRRHGTGEHGEAARYQRGPRAVALHRRDQLEPAFCQRDAPRDHSADDGKGQTLQQRDPFAQGGLERDLAVHRPRRDGGNVFLESDFGREFVDAFLVDHGGIHVGDEQPLAPRILPLDRDVDRQAGECVAQHRFGLCRGEAIRQDDIAGDTLGQPVASACTNRLHRGMRDTG